jgi:hypothetical protein
MTDKKMELKNKNVLHLIDNLQKPQTVDTNPLTTSSAAKAEINFSQQVLSQHCHFIKINEIGFDKDMPRRESLENVISAMNNPEFNFVYLLAGNNDGVDMYLGVTRDYHYPKHSRLHAYDQGELLRESFAGNFHGSSLEDITTEKKLNETVFNHLAKSRRGSIITGVPSINEKAEDKDLYTQKLDNLVNSMNGSMGNWQLLIIGDAMPASEINALKETLYDIYDEVHLSSKITMQESTGINESSNVTMGTGTNKGNNTGTNNSDSKGTSTSNSSSGTSDTHSKGVSKGISTGASTSKSKSQSEGSNSGQSVTTEHINKEHQVLMKYMDDELFDRVNLGLMKGFYKTAIYALAENHLTHQRLVRNLCSMWQGDSSSLSPLRATELPDGITHDLHKVIKHFQSLEVNNALGQYLPLIFGHPDNKDKLEMRTCLTSRELSLICGLPAKELPGIPLRKGVELGLNPKQADALHAINLGTVMHQGTELKNKALMIDKRMLSRHTFIAGVTGSGKTTTCKRLLTESKLPFLIIEPAKTEYRSLLSELDDVQVYTLGNENLAPFRFNPFELMEGESITCHVDLLKAAFTAAFPMEAAMPYLLEEAIYECYKDYGWNTDGWEYTEDANIYFAQPWESNGACWPTMDDLLKNMDRVVKSKNFDSRLESDYTASLVARFKNLTIGAKGQMLNCRLSTDLVGLLDQKVILELDDLKSPEDKCLMMGLIIVRLSEAIKMRFMKDPEFKHISLIEEAHRLLEKPSPGDDGSRKHAVGMFTDLLAEVRKYGESLVIVDQIPNKLAPEVLKNTNMKIIHKLFAKDDRSAIGDTVGLDDEQKDFLTDLRIGEVVIYSGEWSKAVHAKIRETKLAREHSEAELAEHVKVKGAEQLLLQQRRYFPEIAANGIKLSPELLNDYKRIKKRFWKILDNAVEKALLENAGEASNRKFSISFSTLKAMAAHLKPMKVICSSSDEILALLISDIKLRLPLDTDKEVIEEYTLGLQALFNEISVENSNSLESFLNDDLYQELFSKVY